MSGADRALRGVKRGQAHKPLDNVRWPVGVKPAYEGYETACGRLVQPAEVVMLKRTDAADRCKQCFPAEGGASRG